MDENLDLKKLQLQYNDVFQINLGDIDYYYRALTLNEIKEAQLIDDETDKEDFYVTTCLLYPNVNLNSIKAGYVTTLAEAIMSSSGILDLDTVKNYLLESRQFVTQDPISVMKAYVIAAMPSYNDDNLDEISIKELIQKAALSEQILTLKQAVMGIESEGVQMYIVSEEELTESAPTPQKQKLTREEILRRVGKSERETTSVYKRDPKVAAKLKDLDEELLAKMLGEADASDPIAAKLHGRR